MNRLYKTKRNADLWAWLAVMILLPFQEYAEAARYYVDPLNGDPGNAGTYESPWRTLEEVFALGETFEAGDTLYLLSGHHGSVIVEGINDGYVTILPLPGHDPTFKKVTFNNAAKWKLYGVTISPATAPSYSRSTLLVLNSNASEIIVDSCYAYSVEDNTTWSAGDWVSNACNGASVTGDNNILRNNHFLNVDHGILVESAGEQNLIERNIIENFSGDGMRGIGNYNTFAYNTVKNCYDVDDNHDDGFQSYSRGPGNVVGTGTVYGIVLRGNTILNYEDPNQPMRGTLQGIGCFDGMFEDWVVENNVVITDHWHGITLLGARNCRIINNTVVDRNTTTPGPPWISIAAHKDGTLGTGNAIRNNLTTSMDNDAGIGTVEFNIIVSNYDDFFVDYDHFDLRLKEGCPAIDTGTDTDAPLIDIKGNARPQGAGYDVGAYEYPSGPDTVAPVISSVESIRPNEVEVQFNERMDTSTAQQAENYSIDQGVSIEAAILSPDMKMVTLTVSGLVEEVTYTLTVNNVEDLGGNAIEANASMTFEHVCGYATASETQEPNYPENTMDGDLATRWSAEGVQWIKFDICRVHTVSSVEIAFYYGSTRASDFKIEVSLDDEDWRKVFEGSSNGTSDNLETFGFPDVFGRYVRITGSGNSSNDWNSYTEVVINAEILITDMAALEDLVTSASLLHDNAVEGSGIGAYPPGSKAILKEAIDAAQAVLDKEIPDQDEISYAYADLSQAMEDFEASVITGRGELFLPGLRVYPNPFDQQIHLNIPDNIRIQRIYLIDVVGRISAFSAGKDHATLEVGGLSPGVYMLQLHTDKGIINKKIIK